MIIIKKTFDIVVDEMRKILRKLRTSNVSPTIYLIKLVKTAKGKINIYIYISIYK